jgi:hypothetical protein
MLQGVQSQALVAVSRLGKWSIMITAEEIYQSNAMTAQRLWMS